MLCTICGELLNNRMLLVRHKLLCAQCGARYQPCWRKENEGGQVWAFLPILLVQIIVLDNNKNSSVVGILCFLVMICIIFFMWILHRDYDAYKCVQGDKYLLLETALPPTVMGKDDVKMALAIIVIAALTVVTGFCFIY